jgi:hypothetical protein
MSKVHFQLLCDKIEDIVGPAVFKSELYLNEMLKESIIANCERNIFAAHEQSTGGMISGDCFGEINLRWGILWRELNYSLAVNCRIIDACMRLHNLIVEHRMDDESIFRDSVDFEIFDDDCRRFYAVNPFMNHEGVYGGEEDVRRNNDGSIYRGGRPILVESICTEYGKQWRNNHRDDIRRQGLVRPSTNWFRTNNRAFERG